VADAARTHSTELAAAAAHSRDATQCLEEAHRAAQAELMAQCEQLSAALSEKEAALAATAAAKEQLERQLQDAYGRRPRSGSSGLRAPC